MNTRQLLLSFGFTLLTTSVVFGEARCPVNVATIRYHSLGNSQMGVSVIINRSGSYEFLVDTGSQITIVEPSLANALGLQPLGAADAFSVARHTQVELAQLDEIQTGSHAVQQLTVSVQSLAQIQVEDPKVRGILGVNFLSHFDLLIDHAHHILCLDETKQMQQALAGERIPMVVKPDREWNSPFPQPILVNVRLSGNDSRARMLRLDSGTNLPLLHENQLKTAPWVQMQSALRGHVTGGAVEYFAMMPPQDVRIGRHVVSNVKFAAPVRNGENVVFNGEDGLLPTGLFKRVFVSHADHFVIFDPR